MLSSLFSLTAALLPDLITIFAKQSDQVTFSMAIGNVQLMHECLPKHLRMGTARMKQHIKTDEKGETRRVNMERTLYREKDILTT